jgi:hypothetical protein
MAVFLTREQHRDICSGYHPYRFSAKRQQQGISPESQGQNMAWNVFYAPSLPYSLGSGPLYPEAEHETKYRSLKTQTRHPQSDTLNRMD